MNTETLATMLAGVSFLALGLTLGIEGTGLLVAVELGQQSALGAQDIMASEWVTKTKRASWASAVICVSAAGGAAYIWPEE